MAERLIEQDLGGLRLIGHSVAGEETVVAAPELNVCFDVGKAPAHILSIDHVLLSHGHMDHSAGLAYYLSQRNFVGNSPGTVVCAPPLVEPIRDLLRVWGRIEGHVSPGRIVGLAAGSDFEIRRGLLARAFAVNHGASALGYALIDVRRKLRPEYADKTGPQLVALKKQGIDIQYTLEVPLIAYCGDTAEGAFLQLDFVRRAQVLVIECTFYDDDHVRRAREGLHLHVRDLARILPRMENQWIVLTHVSRRTSLRDAKRRLSKLVDPGQLERVRFLMEGRWVQWSGSPPMSESSGRAAAASATVTPPTAG